MIQTDEQQLELLCAKFFPVFQEYLRRKSIATGDIELATSLDGIYSLPAIYDLGGVQKTVRVPVVLLTAEVGNATEECIAATVAANAAAADAEASSAAAMESKRKADESATKANTAAERAEQAIANDYTHVPLTAEEFDLIPVKDERTIYFIYEE